VDRRKLKALHTVERIRRHALDVEAARLGEMQGKMAALERETEALEKSLLLDGIRDTMIEHAPYVGSFVRATRHEIERCRRAADDLRGDLEAQEEVVAHKFTEKKTVDLVAEAEATRLSKAADRKARVAQDDLTIMRYRAAGAGRLS
jgi:flagellar biosynthesis chaperone FliJ